MEQSILQHATNAQADTVGMDQVVLLQAVQMGQSILQHVILVQHDIIEME